MHPPEYSTLQPIRQPFAVMVNPPHCILRSKIISNNKVIPKSSKKSTPRDHLHSRRDFEDHKIEYPHSRWCLWKLKKKPISPNTRFEASCQSMGGGLVQQWMSNDRWCYCLVRFATLPQNCEIPACTYISQLCAVSITQNVPTLL